MPTIASLRMLAILQLCMATAVHARPARLFGFDLNQAVHSAVDGHPLTPAIAALQGHHPLLPALHGQQPEHASVGGATFVASRTPQEETAGATFVAGRAHEPQRLPIAENHPVSPPRSIVASHHTAVEAQSEHVTPPSSFAPGSPQREKSSSSHRSEASHPVAPPIDSSTRPRSTRLKRKADRLGEWHSGESEAETSLHHASSPSKATNLDETASSSAEHQEIGRAPRRTMALSKLYDSTPQVFGTSTVVRRKRTVRAQQAFGLSARQSRTTAVQDEPAKKLNRISEAAKKRRLDPERQYKLSDEQRARHRLAQQRYVAKKPEATKEFMRRIRAEHAEAVMEGRTWTSRDGKTKLTPEQIEERYKGEYQRKANQRRDRTMEDPEYREGLRAYGREWRKKQKLGAVAQIQTGETSGAAIHSSSQSTVAVRGRRTDRVEEAKGLPQSKRPPRQVLRPTPSEAGTETHKTSEAAERRREIVRRAQAKYVAKNPERARAMYTRARLEQTRAMIKGESWTSRDGQKTYTAEDLKRMYREMNRKGSETKRERRAKDPAYKARYNAYMKQYREARKAKEAELGAEAATHPPAGPSATVPSGPSATA